VTGQKESAGPVARAVDAAPLAGWSSSFRVMGAAWGVMRTGKGIHLWRWDGTGWSLVIDLDRDTLDDLVRVLDRYRELAARNKEEER
jgi:hypothetical protein